MSEETLLVRLSKPPRSLSRTERPLTDEDIQYLRSMVTVPTICGVVPPYRRIAYLPAEESIRRQLEGYRGNVTDRAIWKLGTIIAEKMRNYLEPHGTAIGINGAASIIGDQSQGILSSHKTAGTMNEIRPSIATIMKSGTPNAQVTYVSLSNFAATHRQYYDFAITVLNPQIAKFVTISPSGINHEFATLGSIRHKVVNIYRREMRADKPIVTIGIPSSVPPDEANILVVKLNLTQMLVYRVVPEDVAMAIVRCDDFVVAFSRFDVAELYIWGGPTLPSVSTAFTQKSTKLFEENVFESDITVSEQHKCGNSSHAIFHRYVDFDIETFSLVPLFKETRYYPHVGNGSFGTIIDRQFMVKKAICVSRVATIFNAIGISSINFNRGVVYTEINPWGLLERFFAEKSELTTKKRIAFYGPSVGIHYFVHHNEVEEAELYCNEPHIMAAVFGSQIAHISQVLQMIDATATSKTSHATLAPIMSYVSGCGELRSAEKPPIPDPLHDATQAKAAQRINNGAAVGVHITGLTLDAAVITGSPPAYEEYVVNTVPDKNVRYRREGLDVDSIVGVVDAFTDKNPIEFFA